MKLVAEKIFLELDEEIVFVVEKLKKAESDSIILVIPERAALIGSSVSLKLLAQEVAKINKTAVLVTEDEIGLKLAQKAPLVAVTKVSDISEEMWAEARKLKEKLVKRREHAKNALLSERHEQKQYAQERKEKSKDEGLESKEIVESEREEEKKIPEEELKKEIEPEAEKKDSGAELKRLEPRIVDVNGFKMVAGGDIADFHKDEQEDISQKALKDEVTRKEKEKKSSIVGQDVSSISYTALAGKDSEKKVSSGVPSGGVLGVLKEVPKKLLGFAGAKNKFIFIVLGILVVFFVISYFILPTGSVTVKVESQDIKITKEVVADTSTSALNAEKLTVPAKTIQVIKDRSGTAGATGIEITGEKATGQITLYNLSETQTASIPAGTILESVETGLTYSTVKAVTIDKKKLDDDPLLPGLFGTEDVGIISEDFGVDYNSSDRQEFRVAGFDLDVVYGKNFNDITGGTSKEITVVSQEDYTSLKKSLVSEIKEEMLQSLKDEAGVDRELLTDTVKYKVINEDPTPGVGVESDTLNLSVTVKATGLSFSKEDIDSLAQILVEQESEKEVEVEEFEYSSKVKKTEGDKIFISLKITGIVTPSIDVATIKQDLSGISFSEAQGYLDSVEELKDYEISLSPGWLPTFLKHFPGSVSKIDVEIEKISTE